jgi:hypothetical protein
MLMLVTVYPLLSGFFDARLLLNALITSVLLAGLLVIFSQRHLRVVGLVLGIPTLLGLWSDYALPGFSTKPMAIVFHIFAALFLGLTGVELLRAIYREVNVTADTIYGAFCFYLLMGLLFGHLYCIIEWISPGSFDVENAEIAAELQDPHRRRFILTYFSYVTLATVGYGDITPGSKAARALAVLEAISGQFYIAVLVAEFVGKKVARAITAPKPD